jgi:tripartite-type tricarboxylate transporter receptor subunit TctC
LVNRLSSRTGQARAAIIATEAVVRAPADGHTLLLVGPSSATNVTLYDKLSFNFIRDIAPIAGIVRVPNIMEVHPSVPAKTLREFIAYARANPGKLSMASAGNGTIPHIAGELFQMTAGLDMVHVPYRGGAPALTDLLGGQVQALFHDMSSIDHIRAGRLRALAVTSATGLKALPDVPTVGEYIPNYEASAWFGIGAPKGTPTEVIDRLNKQVNASFTDPRTKARLADLGTVLPGSPTEFGKLITEETEKWGKVIRAANIKPD